MQPGFQTTSPLPSETLIAPHHLEMLALSGIDSSTAADCGIRSVMTDAELPDEFQGSRLASTPALVFPWKSPSGTVVLQLRPDNPRSPELMLAEEQEDIQVDDRHNLAKYLFPRGQGGVLNQLRPDADGDLVLLVEGTKQAIAAHRYAPEGVQVFGMMGCFGWSRGGLPIRDLFHLRGKQVVVVLDSDAGSNDKVYSAGVRLAEALYDEGTEWVRFMRLAAGKKNGLDDVLAGRPETDRADFIQRKLDAVTDTKLTKAEITRLGKPADSKPTAKKKEKPAAVIDPTKQPVEATDLDVADAFVALKGESLLWDGSNRQWLTYTDKGIWARDAGETLAKSKFRELVTEDIEAVKPDPDTGELMSMRDWLVQASRINHVLHWASTDPAIHVAAEELDPDPWFWCAANVVINLDSGEVLEQGPEYRMTQQSPVAYDADATRPHFDRWIEEVLPNPAVRRYVQQVLGMSMIGESRERIFPVFKGVGRNGKGTLVRLVRKVFGSYAGGISKALLIETKFEQHTTIVTSLFKRRLATSEELSAKSSWNISSVKELTGGDILTGRRIAENEFDFSPSHTLVLCTNARPQINDADEGAAAFWDRYREIPFDTQFENPDQSVEDRLNGELPGILNWLLDGLAQYRDNGYRLDEPPEVTMATLGAKVDSRPMHRFADEELEITDDDNDMVTNSAMREHYVRWCLRQVPRVKPVAPNVFSKALCKDTRLAMPTPEGKANTNTWHGVRIISADDTDPDGGSGEGFWGSGEGLAKGSARPAERVDPQVEVGAAKGAKSAKGFLDHATQEDGVNEHSTPENGSDSSRIGATGGPEPLAPLANGSAPTSTSEKLAKGSAAQPLASPSPGPRGWAELLAPHVTVTDPAPPCSQCGTPCQPDPELGIFQLCPVCTTGSLRSTDAPEATS